MLRHPEANWFTISAPRVESPLSAVISCGAGVERYLGAHTKHMVTLNEFPPHSGVALPSAPFAAHQHASPSKGSRTTSQKGYTFDAEAVGTGEAVGVR